MVAGAETLKEYEGKKVIILLSDGEDGFPSGMQGALNQLSSQDIVVHTIGLPGCDEDYLMDISKYVITAVLITMFFDDISSSRGLTYIAAIVTAVLTLLLGIVYYKKK